jgi:hypothetical protein
LGVDLAGRPAAVSSGTPAISYIDLCMHRLR